VYCVHCGASLWEGAAFCTECGQAVQSRGNQAASPAATPVSDAPTVVTPPPAQRMPAPHPADEIPPPWGAVGPFAGTQGPAPAPHPRSSSRRNVLIAAGVLIALLAAAGIAFAVRGASTSSTASTLPASPPSLASSSAAPSAAPPPTASSTAAGGDSSFAELYKADSSGVVRIETVSCDGQGVGTGFLLSPTLVATVAHVVDQSAVVSLISGTERMTGTVIGIDTESDLALVQSDRAFSGHQFSLATEQPDVGSRVAAIGFPVGDPITLTQGGISGLNRNITIEGAPRTGLIETDTPINPGNSGGPLLDTKGAVVGLVDALNTEANGIAYAVPAAKASAYFSQWRANPQGQPGAGCANPVGPRQEANPQIAPPSGSGGAAAAGISDALGRYFSGINTGNYTSAYAVLSPRQQASISYSTFVTGTQTSFDTGVTVQRLTPQSAATYIASTTFRSIQSSSQGPGGDTCDYWTLDYTMVQSPSGLWQIDATAGSGGSTHTSC